MTEHKPLALEVLARIQSEKIEPLPRWRFLLPRLVFWAITALSIVIGSHIVVTVLAVLFDLNGDLPGALPIRVFIGAGFATVPLLWLVLILVLVIIATLVIRTTGRGYRFPIWRLLSLNIGATLLVGLMFYTLGERLPLERYLLPTPFMGSSVHERHVDFWTNPEDGRIMGRIDMLSGTTATIVTRNDQSYTITLPAGAPDLPPFVLSGSVVRAVGKWDGTVFRVEEFLPDRPLPRGFEAGKNFFERKRIDPAYEDADRPILEGSSKIIP